MASLDQRRSASAGSESNAGPVGRSTELNPLPGSAVLRIVPGTALLRQVIYVSSEPEAATGYRLDPELACSIIANRCTGRVDPRADGGIRDRSATPNDFDQLVSGNQPAPLRHKQAKEVEDLRLDGSRLARHQQLLVVQAKFAFAQPVPHAADGRLCAVTRCVVRTARTVALRITARWRPAS